MVMNLFFVIKREIRAKTNETKSDDDIRINKEKDASKLFTLV